MVDRGPESRRFLVAVGAGFSHRGLGGRRCGLGFVAWRCRRWRIAGVPAGVPAGFAVVPPVFFFGGRPVVAVAVVVKGHFFEGIPAEFFLPVGKGRDGDKTLQVSLLAPHDVPETRVVDVQPVGDVLQGQRLARGPPAPVALDGLRAQEDHLGHDDLEGIPRVGDLLDDTPLQVLFAPGDVPKPVPGLPDRARLVPVRVPAEGLVIAVSRHRWLVGWFLGWFLGCFLIACGKQVSERSARRPCLPKPENRTLPGSSGCASSSSCLVSTRLHQTRSTRVQGRVKRRPNGIPSGISNRKDPESTPADSVGCVQPKQERPAKILLDGSCC